VQLLKMKQLSKFFIACLIIWAINGQAAEDQAVIFMYHHFGVSKYPSTNVTLEQFDAHLYHLEEAGYEIWPLERIVKHLKQRQPFPTRVAAITIDDAYLSVYREAFPRLRARGWPFTVFVSSNGIDRGFKAFMTWQQMREMKAHNVTFANHSASHDYLIRRRKGETEAQWLTRMRKDIQHGQQRIEEELGQAPLLFAYPYGEYDTALAHLLQELGYTAFGQHSGPAGFSDNLQALPRFPMNERFAGIGEFRLKAASLAFPVQSVSPWEPLLGQENPPRLEIGLGESTARLSQLSCYVSGQGEAEAQWLDRKQRRFAIQAAASLPIGRSRYNCTAPSSQPGRFYWYSHPWIRLDPEAGDDAYPPETP
jgi:biofilm PGA synthesis lipoprotein PgaB